MDHPCDSVSRCRELIVVAVSRIDCDPIVGDRFVDPALEIAVAHFKKIIALKRAGRGNPMTHENAEDLTADVLVGRSVRHRSTIGFARHRSYGHTATVDKIAQLILADLHSNLRGVAVHSVVRERGGECPVLALSGHRLVQCTCLLLTQSGHRRIAFPGHRCDCVGAMPNRLSNVAPQRSRKLELCDRNAAHRNMKGFTTCLTIQSGMASIAAIS